MVSMSVGPLRWPAIIVPDPEDSDTEELTEDNEEKENKHVYISCFYHAGDKSAECTCKRFL